MPVTWALSLVAIIAMSVRILFSSHDRCQCWTVGSLPYLVELRFIRLSLVSRVYQSKLSPLEGHARPGL